MSHMNATPEPARRVSARLAAIQESATLAVDAKAKALKAEGRPVIGFGAGEPDFPTPAHIVEVAAAATRDPKNHRYTPAAGLPELRKAIADKTFADSGVEVSPANILVTNGGKQAVYQAFAAITDEGDEIILPAPYWTTYPEAIRLCGGVPVEVFAGSDQEYKVTVEQLEAARTEKSKAVLICSPSNPTGSVYSADELRAIGQWALDNGIWVISDEIYEHLVYGDEPVARILQVVPELAIQTIILNGVAKTYAMTGWRLGYVVAPPAITRAIRALKGMVSVCAPLPSQWAGVAALDGPQDCVAAFRASYDERRRALMRVLTESGFTYGHPYGAFYIFANTSATGVPAFDLAMRLLLEGRVLVFPGTGFGEGWKDYLRFSLLQPTPVLLEALDRLKRVVG